MDQLLNMESMKTQPLPMPKACKSKGNNGNIGGAIVSCRKFRFTRYPRTVPNVQIQFKISRLSPVSSKFKGIKMARDRIVKGAM
eukprot:scaffold11271_cov297-Chaetoceros_neogracile.AAC.1